MRTSHLEQGGDDSYHCGTNPTTTHEDGSGGSSEPRTGNQCCLACITLLTVDVVGPTEQGSSHPARVVEDGRRQLV